MQTRCIAPLLALTGVFVGVSYVADFPQYPYGDPTDVPFAGGVEPTGDESSVDAELSTRPSYGGADGPEATLEAISILTGGAVHPTARALTCSGDRVAGGCWRAGAARLIVLHTDSPIHNGPDPTTGGLHEVYTDVLPAPAGWSDVRERLMSTDTLLMFLDSTMWDRVSTAQFDLMLSQLGQPASDRIGVSSPATVEAACDAIVARVQAIAGR